MKPLVPASTPVTVIHDRDTFEVDLSDCWQPIVCRDVSIRINGIDTPELHDARPALRAKAEQARDRLKQLLSPGHVVEIRNAKPDKFGGRLDADVYSDGKSVAEVLKAEGLAKSYNGRGAKPW